MNVSKILFILVLVSLVGLGLFALYAWRASDITTVDHNTAMIAFQAARHGHQERPALLARDSFGRITPHLPIHELPVAEPTRLIILAYFPDTGRLVRTDLPFWFMRLKSQALAFALRPTHFDLNNLGLSADQLAAAGPGIVVDEVRRTGEHYLIWLE